MKETKVYLSTSINPTSAKFSDCNRVRQSGEVDETGHRQDSRCSAGTGCAYGAGRHLTFVTTG